MHAFGLLEHTGAHAERPHTGSLPLIPKLTLSNLFIFQNTKYKKKNVFMTQKTILTKPHIPLKVMLLMGITNSINKIAIAAG